MTAPTRLSRTADGGSVLELEVAAPVRVKRPTRRVKWSTILPGVFPPGTWPDPVKEPEAHSKAVAEYQYLRAASGICRSCPNTLNRWKHRCDSCQEKERVRLRNSGKARRPGRTLAHGFRKRRTSKFAKKAQQWLAHQTWKKRKQRQQQQEQHGNIQGRHRLQ